MKAKSYYVQININTLPHYFVGGCIRPVSLIERREEDIQNIYPNNILLCNKKWDNSSDCSIEILLNENEIKQLDQLGSDYNLYNSIIPISRIKQIHITDKEKAETVTWNIENGAGYLPKDKIKIAEKLAEEIAGNPTQSKTNLSIDTTLLKLNYIKFNRLMGGFAFMRTSLVDIYDVNINYPQNYISTFAFFNKTIKRELEKVDSKANFYLQSIFTGESDIINYLAKEINDHLLQDVSKREKLMLKSKFGTYDLSALPKNSLTYRLCILLTYGKSGSKSIEDMINVLYQELGIKVKEEIALIFGLYSGYENLRNFYRINTTEVKVKFDLSSKLDYYIIESLYQFTFNNKTISEGFDYIESIIPEEQNIDAPNGYKYFKLMGNYIITKKKDYVEHLEGLISELTREFSDWFPKSIVSVNKEAMSQILLEKLKNNFEILIQEVKSDAKINQESKSKKENTNAVEIKVAIKKESEDLKPVINNTIPISELSYVIPIKENKSEKPVNENNKELQSKQENETKDTEFESKTDITIIKQTAILTEEELNEKNIPELLKYASDSGIKLTTKEKKEKKAILNRILAEQVTGKLDFE